jgi:hypothetical protein
MTRTLALPLLLLSLLPPPAAAQPSSALVEAERAAKRLVVAIDAVSEDRAEKGSGIVIRQDGDRIYVLTANHVVRHSGEDAETTIRLANDPRRLPATLNEYRYGDVALLEAALPAGLPPFDFARLVVLSRDQVKANASARLLGYPGGQPALEASLFSRQRAPQGESVTLERTCAEGWSGGAVVDAQWRFVGLIQRSHDGGCEAAILEPVMELIRAEAGVAPSLDDSSPVVVLQPFAVPPGTAAAVAAAGNAALQQIFAREPHLTVLDAAVGQPGSATRTVLGRLTPPVVERRRLQEYGLDMIGDAYRFSVEVEVRDHHGDVWFSRSYTHRFDLRYDTGKEPAEPAPLPPQALSEAVEKSAEDLAALF